MFDPARLVFIDETCTHTKMVRPYGRSPRGERLIGYAPHGHWKTITFVAGLRLRAITAPFVLEGAMNGPMFLAYVKQCLVPTLKRGDIVAMDNLPGIGSLVLRRRSRQGVRGCTICRPIRPTSTRSRSPSAN